MKFNISKKIKHQLFAYSLVLLLLATFFLFYRKDFLLVEEPGSMSKAHRFLSGQCEQCHQNHDPGFTKTCTACHQEIKTDKRHFLQSQSGIFHSNIGEAKNCASCHKEHRGDQTSLILWQFFDHSKTDFQVVGLHRYITCKDCHKGVEEGRKQWYHLSKTPEKTLYQMNDYSCYGCHQKDDIHRGSKGRNCEKCHPQYLRWSE